MIFIYNILFYFLFFLFSFFYIPAGSIYVALVRIMCSHRAAMKCFRRAISLYGYVIVFILPRFFIKVRPRGFDNSIGPCVYVANHRSASDAFLMAAVPGEIVQVVNKWPFRLPVLGIYAKWAGYLSVREMPYEQFKDECLHLLSRGCSIVAFPEGTRSGDLSMGQFHGAVIRAAQEAKASIVPICIMGNEDKPERGNIVLNPGEIHIHCLDAFTWDKYKAMNPFKLKNHIRSKMIEYIKENES